MHSDARLSLTPSSQKMALALLTQYPVTTKERQDLLPPTDRERNPYPLNEGEQTILCCLKIFFFFFGSIHL
jgi:hypothetical protein